MSIEILSASEIVRLRAAGAAAANTLTDVSREICAGMTTADLDAIVVESTRRQGGTCAPLGYGGGRGVPPFPRSVCTSVNDVVCHGIPSARQVLRRGDIVNVDVTTCLDGMHGDCSFTFCIGEIDLKTRKLVDICRQTLEAAIAIVKPGIRFGEIGTLVETQAHAAGLSVVDAFGGHGIGRRMHMDPHVSHVRPTRPTPRIRAGMAFTIEPILNLGTDAIVVLDDGWTVVTRDGAKSAQFEHTLLVTESGCEVTTQHAL